MDTLLECMIEVDGHLLCYKGVIEVRVNHFHLLVRLDEQYTTTKDEILTRYNVSTTPFVHQFYNAKIIAVRGLKQD